MAENQSATEDSGRQTQHQHHTHQQQQQQQQETQQQAHQHQHQNQTPQSPQQQDDQQLTTLATSPISTSPQDNSASSPEETQTTITAAKPLMNHQRPQHQATDSNKSLNMFGRQMNAKLKNSSNNFTQRRSSLNAVISSNIRSTSTTSIKKPPLTKMTSLTATVTPANTDATATAGNKHHHHHHQHQQHFHHHHHQHHNNTSNHTVTQHRTTSESLRLSSSPGANNAIASSSTEEAANGRTLSNATSNSSLHNTTATATRSSSSTSLAPQSTATNASSSGVSRTSSPNNNNNTSTSSATTSSRSSHHSHSQGHASHASSHQQHTIGIRKTKTTTSSFQITSVTVGGPGTGKLSSENGEESADDLDESHTDDNSSRITDLENETPSMSEDTFSKEEVYFSNTALSTTAPVIPTSAQYGLVVVDPIGPTLSGQTIQNVQVNVADNIINVVSAVAPGGSKKKEDLKEAQQRSERFKVVKIESTEPFRRGRWMCMDYLDHSSVGGGNNEKTGSGDGTEGNGNGSEASVPTGAKTTQSMIIGPGAAALLENHVDALTSNSLQLTNADGNWNYAEGCSPSPNPLQQQMSAPSGVATAPATVVHGMQQFSTRTTAGDETQATNTVDKSTNQNGEQVGGGSIDYATAAAQQLQQSLEQLKKQEEAIAASEEAASGNNAGGSSVYNQGQSQVNYNAGQQQSATMPNTLLNIVTNETSSNNVSGQNNNTTSSPNMQQQGLEIEQMQSMSQQQQPMSPVPHSAPASQIASTYASNAAVASNAYNQQQTSFQNAQQPSPPIPIPTSDAMSLQKPQQTQQTQQAAPQTSSSPQRQQPQIQPQPTSQTDGIPTQQAAAVTSIATTVQQPTQYQQQQQQSTTIQGQTLPTALTQMTGFEVHPTGQQQQQQQSSTTTTATHHLNATLAATAAPQHQQMQSAPATLSDPNIIVANIQAENGVTLSNTTLTNETIPNNNNNNVNNSNSNNINQNTTNDMNLQQQQQQPQIVLQNDGSSTNGNINVVSNNSVATAVGAVLSTNTTSVTAAASAASSSTPATQVVAVTGGTTVNIDETLQLQQLQPNPETETESSISQATIYANHQRKRAHSTPYISPNVAAMLNPTISFNINNTTNVHYYSQTSSGRTSFCMDGGDAVWSTTNTKTSGYSDSNIYTNLALGDERYKLPAEISFTRESSVGFTTGDEFDISNDADDDNDEDEAIDQFSPGIYALSFKPPQRSIPIPINAGNSPQHNARIIIDAGSGRGIGNGVGGSPHVSGAFTSPTRMVAYSAGPTTATNAYSPFYCGSPETQSPVGSGVGGIGLNPNGRISFSYDPAYGACINRLPLPLQQQQQSLQDTSKSQQQRNLTSPIAVILSSSSPTSPSEFNSASGTSAVAIDNKIEQAMDLVKSHLMIAVREEVEVLKEKISELMDKINQLEVENTILKANISQETLQQLQIQTQLQIAGSASSTAAAAGNNMLTAPPTTETTTVENNTTNVATTATVGNNAAQQQQQSNNSATLQTVTNNATTTAGTAPTSAAATNGPMS